MPDDFTQAKVVNRGPLAQRREALGLTQEDLAKLLGVERSVIARWENDDAEPLGGIRPQLAQALCVSGDRLEELLAAAPEHADRGKPGEPDVPRQLPAAVADFAGRGAELDTLTRILDEARGGTPGTVVISAIGGTAGVGKTALALHWAHQVAHRFPDGQLHVNLRGFDPAGTPVTPDDAIRGFLDALGVPPDRIPRSADAQAGLYRSLLVGRRMLVVLDNARDERQVRPLLPASPGSLVLVTSRNQITGLAAADGARVLTLDVLTHAEAVQMLTARLGGSRAAAEPGAVGEIATLCACLPLALSVASARVAARPGFPLAALAAELRAAPGRLDALDVGDPQASVQAVFSWSYQQLSPDAAQMFRLMGLHPGPDISVSAAAGLAGGDEPQARRLLRELTRDCLIAEHLPGRYAFHDLLRTYAANQARAIDREPERAAAIGRILDYYAHTARAAAILLYPSREMIAFAPHIPVIGTELPADDQHAVAWFEAERANLTAGVTLAAESGFDSHAWQLPWFMAAHFARRGYWNERVALQRTALTAATRLEDSAGQAVSSRLLANAHMDLGDHDQALRYYRASAGLYQRLGNRLGEAKACQGIATVAGRQGRYADALRYFDYALQLHQAIGHKLGEAEILINMGFCYGGLGDYEEGHELCRRSLALAAELGNRYVEALAWHGLGYSELILDDFNAAAASFQQALNSARKAGDRFHQADALTHLGDIRQAAGQALEARDAWSGALAIFEEIQHPDAHRVRSKLADLGRPGSAPAGDDLFLHDPAARRLHPPWCALIRYAAALRKPSTSNVPTTTSTVRLRKIDV